MITNIDPKGYLPPSDLIPQIYLAQFEGINGELTLQNGDQVEIQWRGEMLLDMQKNDEGRWNVQSFREIALNSSSVEALSGAISIAGPRDDFKAEYSSSREVIPVNMRGYYPFLNNFGPACKESDATYPLLERFLGEVMINIMDEAQNESEVKVEIFIKQESSNENNFEGLLQSCSFGPTLLNFKPLPTQPPSENLHHSLVTCMVPPPGGTGHIHKKLNLRFVSLLSPQPLMSNLELWVQELIEGACTVWWSKGGIKIDPQSTIDLGSFLDGIIPLLQETAVPTNVGQDTNRIDIYLVEQLVARPGGGVTQACGTNSAYILLEMGKARNNKYLLAHELGHVLGLYHPGGSPDCSEFREGSFCSVMVPDRPNSSRNTSNNLEVIETPSYPLTFPILQTISIGGWAVDTAQGYFHIIRDYPYDTGDPEPSKPQTPFVNFWSASDVWNSSKSPKSGQNKDLLYADNTSMFHADHSPVHSNPFYSAPISPINRMYVQLHGCESLQSPVDVYLYLAVPGSSSKPLSPLNGTNGPHLIFSSTDLPSTLPTPGTPKNKNIAWTVPPGIPSHSCMFAVAKSANQPTLSDLNDIINRPTDFNVYDIVTFRNPNNDVAQRNMDIRAVPLFGGDFLETMTAWVEFSHGDDGLESAILEVDTSRVREQTLLRLVLEINEKVVDEIPIGETWRLAVQDDLRQEEQLIIRLRAVLPPGLPEGTTVPIDLQFFVNNDFEPITGYHHLIRLAPLSETVFQVLDGLAGTLRDVGQGCQLSLAHDLSEKLVDFLVREMPIEPIESRYKYWVTELKSYTDLFAELVDAMQLNAQIDETFPLISGNLKKLWEFLGENWENQPQELLIERIRVLTDRIQEPACRSVRLQFG